MRFSFKVLLIYLLLMSLPEWASGDSLHRAIKQARDIISFPKKPPVETCQHNTAPLVATSAGDLRRHSCLFDKPVIVSGASVSSNFQFGVSPLSTLLSQQASPPKADFIASPGAASDGQIQKIKRLLSEDSKAEIIFGIDLFFWDSTSSDCQAGLNNVRELMALAQKHNKKLILGNIPALKKRKLPLCGGALNTELNKCKDLSFCRLVDLNAAFEDLENQGSYKVGKGSYTKEDIMIDSLHLSRNGAFVVAEEIMRTLDASPLCSSN